MIEILSTFPLNTIQDLGRFGSRSLGVSTSGVMDPLALKIGNALLQNPEESAGVEIQTFPFAARFLLRAAFALTGGDCAPTLDGRRLPPWWLATAESGQTLKLHPPTRGARVYLTISGGFDVPVVLGSRSTHLRSGFGGHFGRSLANGDVLNAISRSNRTASSLPLEFGVEPPEIVIPPRYPAIADNVLPVRVLRAGEYDLFPPDAQQRFWETNWKVTHQSDRGGYRLGGGPLRFEAPVEMRSHGIIAGVVQVPPSGEPIIQLSDANTAGGYPKIAGVIEADIWRLAQVRIGSSIRFVDTSYEDAIDAMAPIETYLSQVRRLVRLHRNRPL